MYNDIRKFIKLSKARRKFLEADWNVEKDRRLLSFYVKIIPIVLNSERCSIFIHDPETDTVWLKSGTGVTEKQIEVSKSDSFAGEVISTGASKIVENMENLRGAHGRVAEETGFITRNLLCIPIKSLDGEDVTGAIQVLNKKDGGFIDADQEMLEELAHFLELTIENVFYNQQMTGTLESTFDTLRKITIASVAIILFLSFLIIGYVGFSVFA